MGATMFFQTALFVVFNKVVTSQVSSFLIGYRFGSLLFSLVGFSFALGILRLGLRCFALREGRRSWNGGGTEMEVERRWGWRVEWVIRTMPT